MSVYDKYFKKMNEIMKENMRLQPCTSCGAMIGLHGQHREDCIFNSDNDYKIGSKLRIRLPRDFKVKEKTMTRNEAKLKVQAITNSTWTQRDIVDFVDCLIELGILKVVDPEPIETMFGISVKSIIKGLEDNGYIVIKQSGI